MLQHVRHPAAPGGRKSSADPLRPHAGTVDLSEFIPVFRTLRETAILRRSSSRPVEPLRLENWLQQRIATRTGQDDTTR